MKIKDATQGDFDILFQQHCDGTMPTREMQHRGQSEARPEDHEPPDGAQGGGLCCGVGTLRQYGQLDQRSRQTGCLWKKMWK